MLVSLNVSGSDNQTHNLGIVFFWIGFGFFVFGSTAFLISAINTRSEKVRAFSVTNCVITAIAATSYYTMARSEGYSVKATTGRYIYWVRYVDWALTTPLILLDMANLAGASRSLTALILVFDELMIILGLASVLSLDDGTKWGWFALGNVAFVPILYLVLVDYQKYKRPEVSGAYNTHAIYLSVLWILYPIAVGLGSEGEVISSDAETVWIAVLDILAKTVFGSILLTLFRPALPFGEGLLADHPASLPRHAEYDERDLEGLDPSTKQTYLIRRAGAVGGNVSSNEASRNVVVQQPLVPATVTTTTTAVPY